MSTESKDGGPAFPFAATDHSNMEMQTSGMSLRDYFAGQYLAGSMANHQISGDEIETAWWAYKFADAMLAARAKEPTR